MSESWGLVRVKRGWVPGWLWRLCCIHGRAARRSVVVTVSIWVAGVAAALAAGSAIHGLPRYAKWPLLFFAEVLMIAIVGRLVWLRATRASKPGIPEPATERFTIRYARIRYNPPKDTSFVVEEKDGSGTVIGGIVTLSGWTPEFASITDCHIECDKTLSPGTMLIEPLRSVKR